jgi:putative transposase
VIAAAVEIAPAVGVAFACRSLAVSRATFFRHRTRLADVPAVPTVCSPDEAILASSEESLPMTNDSESRPSTDGEAPTATDANVPSPPGDQNGPPNGARETTGVERPNDPSGAAPNETVASAPPVRLSTCRVPGRALASAERQAVLDALHSDRFVDHSPAEVYATLLDEGVYLGSIRTFYRVLDSEGESQERRRGHERRNYARPELLATRPNELWSWDITKLLGPFKWTYYYLYVLLDVFSRYVVGWTLDYQESAPIAERLIEESCRKQAIEPGRLTLHADRGPSMTSHTVSELLVNLGVAKTHSRPYTSNDNPYSEAQFKTLKYRPEFPDRFGSMEESQTFSRAFFPWYNTEHRHSGLALMTPETVHYGRVEEVARARQEVLSAAFAQHPERFVGHPPVAGLPPDRVWINPPESPKPSEPDLEKKEGYATTVLRQP